jgi:aspartyl-tRNA(Asn)/glutamyl-tRNA(Gln) amidotransferase subunit A
MKDLSLIEIIDQIKTGKTTSEEVFQYFLKRIEKYDGKVQSFNFVNTAGLTNNPNTVLAGAPIGIKDIFCETGIPTTCGSKMLEGFLPPYDATVIKHLKEAGMSSIGKLNMDEFAMGSTCETSYYRKTLNPWGTNRIPGGSSG